MFNIARAALVSAGVAENDLPRTHTGIIASFSQHAVQSGRIDPGLAAGLGRAETLRLRADYSGTEFDPRDAAETVARAEAFVVGVARVFALEDGNPDHEDKVSEPAAAVERRQTSSPHLQTFSLEEERRQARENWLRLRQQKIERSRDIGHEELSPSPDNDMDE